LIYVNLSASFFSPPRQLLRAKLDEAVDRPKRWRLRPMPGQTTESQTILVVGGGIAGITAALEAAETGCEVILLDKTASLGACRPAIRE